MDHSRMKRPNSKMGSTSASKQEAALCLFQISLFDSGIVFVLIIIHLKGSSFLPYSLKKCHLISWAAPLSTVTNNWCNEKELTFRRKEWSVLNEVKCMRETASQFKSSNQSGSHFIQTIYKTKGLMQQKKYKANISNLIISQHSV